MRSAKLVLASVTLALLLVPALARAERAQAQRAGGPAGIPAPQYRITTAYAKRLVSQVATELHGKNGRGWTVELKAREGGPVGGSTLAFRAKVNWGRGLHILNAAGGNVGALVYVPDVTGTVNMQKAPGAPKGKARVTVDPNAQGN